MRTGWQGAAWRAGVIVLSVLALLLGGCGTESYLSVAGGSPVPAPHFDHIVIVVEENHSYDDIMSSGDAGYIQSLAGQGALFTDAHGVAHPSQPNYLALFAGSTFGVASDDCPQSFNGPDLGGELIAAGQSFVGYAEDLPQAGATDCFANSDAYARKHNPWVDFADVPAASNQPFSAFPGDFTQLPSVAFVVPNQLDDMHTSSIGAADAWLRTNLDPYAQWAMTHNSLLIVTWDEDDSSTTTNHILTFFVGAHLKPGRYAETISHYDVLRTVEALEGLSFTNNATSATTIADVWQS